LVALEDLGDVAPGVEDRLVGADDAAGAAVDAQRGLDEKRLLRFAADGASWAPLLASGAAGTVLGDDQKGHARVLLRRAKGRVATTSASLSGSRRSGLARSVDRCGALA